LVKNIKLTRLSRDEKKTIYLIGVSLARRSSWIRHECSYGGEITPPRDPFIHRRIEFVLYRIFFNRMAEKKKDEEIAMECSPLPAVYYIQVKSTRQIGYAHRVRIFITIHRFFKTISHWTRQLTTFTVWRCVALARITRKLFCRTNNVQLLLFTHSRARCTGIHTILTGMCVVCLY